MLRANGTVISRNTVSRVTNIESQNDDNKARITALYKAIQELLNGKAHVIVEGGQGDSKDCIGHPFDSDPDFQEEFIYVVSNEEVTESDNGFLSYLYYETYLSMELSPPQKGELEPHFDRVTKHRRNANGVPIVKTSDKPIFDTRM